MKKTTLAIAVSLIATTAVAGIASAASGPNARDGVTTRAEAQSHAGQMFAEMDANKDGKIDAADRAAHQAEMFDKLDADHNGTISRDEFANAHPPREAMGRPQGGPQARRGGSDGPEGPRMGGRHRGGQGMGMMMVRMADTDKNGSVTQAEFTSAALAHFDRADANKDGQLTREERRASHQQMREHMGKMRGGHEGHPPPAA